MSFNGIDRRLLERLEQRAAADEATERTRMNDYEAAESERIDQRKRDREMLWGPSFKAVGCTSNEVERIPDGLRSQVELATVSLKGGRGFLVAGNNILTAAHCIEAVDYSAAAAARAGYDEVFEIVETKMRRYTLSVSALEPFADIAMLSGSAAPQLPFENNELFWSFTEETDPLRLCTEEFELFEPFPVYVFTHEGDWIAGRAKLSALGPRAFLLIEFDEDINEGSSGSPIVNGEGQVVGVLSTLRGTLVIAPRPHQVLPVWAVRKITNAENEAIAAGRR
jgi:hypothetical protein